MELQKTLSNPCPLAHLDPSLWKHKDNEISLAKATFFPSVSTTRPCAAVSGSRSPTFLSQTTTNCFNVGNEGAADVSQPLHEAEPMENRLPELREVLAILKSKRSMSNSNEADKAPGQVFLVGTGPGDPELMTVKAARLLQTADLVLYDRLITMDILDMIKPGAKLLYVGKSAGYHSRTQEEIHELLLAFAEAGATVIRLKGGDPMVFGRGGEEMEFLQQRGIRVQIVPGITSASGIAADLGIPLTQRGYANSVRFLTGHSRKGGEDPLHVAESAGDPDSTLVIYMGLATLQGLVSKLLANGLPPWTPAVAVERGTTPEQRTVFERLESLPDAVEMAALQSPTLIVIGRVVALSPHWPLQYQENVEPSVALGYMHSNSSTAGSREPRARAMRGNDPLLPSQRIIPSQCIDSIN